MNFRQNDILIRKTSDSQTTWLSERLVSEVCGVSNEYFRKVRTHYKKSVANCYQRFNILPASGKSWRWAKINGLFYYDLDFIPNQKPTFYRDLFGDKADLLERFKEFGNNTENSLLESQFNSYIKANENDFLHCYLDCTKEQQKALAKACAVLEFSVRYIQENEFRTQNEGYKLLSALIEKNDFRYLPKNYRILKEKVSEVIDNGQAIAEVIRLPRAGNENAVEYNDPEVWNWAMQLTAMGQNYSNDWKTRKIQDMCRMVGKKVPSRRWFGQNIYEQHNTKFLTASQRFGKGTTKASLYEGYIPFENALFAGDCWQVDATRVNMIAHKADDGSKKFLYIVAVRDVHSGDILGQCFDYSENRWSVLNAVKMAVQSAGYLPYEIVFDRFPGHNTEEAKALFSTLQKLKVKVTIAHNANAKAGLERWFGTLQSVFMADSQYYYGEGIKSRRLHAHRSPDYLAKLDKESKKAGFNLIDAYAEAENIVEAYRTTVYSYYSRKNKDLNKSPKLIHDESDKPHVQWVENHQISMIFGLKKKLQIRNGFIKTEIQGMEYIYQVEDYDILSTEPEVIISYDMEDLSTVYLFKKAKDNFLIHLGEAQEFKRVVIHGPQAEFNRVNTEKQKQAEIERKKAEELEEKKGYNNDVALLMGRFTDKAEAENAETVFLLNSIEEPKKRTHKKAVGSDFSTANSLEIDINSLTQKQY
ncbi:MAG: DDE-type integrase/transposase/recombinase [Flavobacterium lindanitolerans]|uniref:integrase catalytic domain-containing protein n=1 Tax=Flavobacterium lindanitolerans TaxID=428988 RepID=UPI001A3CBEA7|nr:transposase [Flavobacterium lindanitolerans]MBL7868850.1 DDE-type integrase/transposase/recombinase [Flavobacterium lindanitolerans]